MKIAKKYAIYVQDLLYGKISIRAPKQFFFSRKFKGIRMNHKDKECKELKEIERERYFKEIKIKIYRKIKKEMQGNQKEKLK